MLSSSSSESSRPIDNPGIFSIQVFPSWIPSTGLVLSMFKSPFNHLLHDRGGAYLKILLEKGDLLERRLIRAFAVMKIPFTLERIQSGTDPLRIRTNFW